MADHQAGGTFFKRSFPMYRKSPLLGEEAGFPKRTKTRSYADAQHLRNICAFPDGVSRRTTSGFLPQKRQVACCAFNSARAVTFVLESFLAIRHLQHLRIKSLCNSLCGYYTTSMLSPQRQHDDSDEDQDKEKDDQGDDGPCRTGLLDRRGRWGRRRSGFDRSRGRPRLHLRRGREIGAACRRVRSARLDGSGFRRRVEDLAALPAGILFRHILVARPTVRASYGRHRFTP